jgi:serine/threonine-protein kinase
LTPDDTQNAAPGVTTADGRLVAGRYRLERRLGGGGMAEVYLATDTTLERQVAVKLLRASFADDDEFVARFHREARAAAALNHPNVVAIHDHGGAAGSSFIVMEYVPGETLKDLVRRVGSLAPAAARDIACDLLAALQAAHERGIVHRDVTAQNVLLAPDGRVKVTDFGIAHFGPSSLTSTGVVMGTSRYLSPEQARGEPTDERSDVYSAGVVLFEMLTGRLPFEGDNDLAIALRHTSESAPAPSEVAPGVPPVLDAIVGRALRKDPGERFASAREFAEALRAAPLGADAHTPGAPPETAVAPIAGAPPAATRIAAAPLAAATRTAVAPSTAATRVTPTTTRARSRRRRLLWLTVALAVVTALGALVGYRAWAGRALPLPAVVGLTPARAAGALHAKGFVAATTGGFSDVYRSGTVMAQRPRAGTALHKGAVVRLVVSRGLLHPAVPGVAGSTASAAAAALRAAGFVPVAFHHHSSAPVGQVDRQSPAAATSLLRGSTVRYWISVGPLGVVVPNVVGAAQGDAADTLHAAGFAVAVNDTLGLGSFPGDVARQSPAAGSRLARGAQVTIWVAIF